MPDPAELTPSNSAPKFVGKYRIVRMIARSNDTVYEAIDPHLGRHVALKELTMGADLSGAGRRERIERFHREAKAAGALKHPNIVTIYEVGQHLEHRFIAMEYLEGQTLRNRLTIGGPMPIKEALQIALQLCDALGYAHAQGVVHRDVKPDNIHIIPPGSTVKLTDFGIARVLTEPAITSAGQIFGTPSYMSPEQLTSRSVDHRSDIFSTAIVIYEMLTGKKPFRGDSLSAVTSQIMHAEPSIPSTVPAGIAAILTRAFMKDPDQRYQNMRTLANDLRTELAFSDSPYHTPRSAPSLASEKTVVVGASGPEAPSLVGTEPTVAADAGAGPTVASKTAPTTLSPEPRSVIGSLDADERLRAAVLRLAAISATTRPWAATSRESPMRPTGTLARPSRAMRRACRR
jgi:serine/threonine protein kinase